MQNGENGSVNENVGTEPLVAETQTDVPENGESVAKKHKGFTGKIGFVLAAAGSAVGLGNLWRFPYLAAKYGGGIFLLVYILLAVTFGFSLLVLEIGIGRLTGKDVIGAFGKLNKKTKWFGFVSLVVPVLIVPYYCVIGGWVTKYLFAYMSGDGSTGAMTGENAALYFNNFISSSWEPIVFFIIFALLSFAVVIFGVQKGIEKIGKILMPILAVLSVGLAIFAMCQKGAVEGIKYFLVPKLEGVNIAEVFLAALGQLFYSMSLAMCIMITYGSYMKKNTDIQKSARQISVFDTCFAIVAGLITIVAYSINNTIVVFDRIRSVVKPLNKQGKKYDVKEVINHAIFSTMTRTLYTTLTTLVVIVILVAMGVASIQTFGLPIIFGLIAGFYSSVFIASPLWGELKTLGEKIKLNAKNKKFEKRHRAKT